jgi:uncharacterized membrane protein
MVVAPGWAIILIGSILIALIIALCVIIYYQYDIDKYNAEVLKSVEDVCKINDKIIDNYNDYIDISDKEIKLLKSLIDASNNVVDSHSKEIDLLSKRINMFDFNKNSEDKE